MLDWFIWILIGMALFFTFAGIYMMRENDYFWAFILTLIATVTWYFLAAGVMEIETPYQIFNNTSGNIETGLHEYHSSNAPSMLYYFFMFAIITFMLNFSILILGLWDAIKKRRRY